MTAAAAISAPVILRNAAGEPPLGSAGAFFRDDQGEMFVHPAEAYRTPATRIGILELDNGKWLALPPSFHVERPQYSSREAALRAGIASLIRRARKYMRNKDGEGTHWTEGYAGRVVEWALSLKPEKNLDHRAADVAAAPSGHPGLAGDAADATAGVTDDTRGAHDGAVIQNTDPVVAALMDAHRARKEYPAGHTFSMTNPTVNGQWVTLGTCTCGDTFSYPYGSAGHERMDAAIEAHWQRFDHLADKIDGRGNPIGTGDGSVASTKGARRAPRGERASPKKSRAAQPAETVPPEPASRTPSALDAGSPQPDAPEGIPASIIADAGIQAASRSEPAPSLPPDGAGSIIEEAAHPSSPAQICAGFAGTGISAGSDDDWLLRAAADLAWREPPQVTPSLAALLDFSKVYAIGAEVTRPLLRWHGGKWKLAPWIIAHFPPHRVYVEPFGGAGSVLMRKLPALSEIYNDLDVEVVNLFRVLRSADAPRLIDLLRLTPFGRAEFDEAFEFSPDQVERARRLIVRSFFAGGSRGVLDLDRAMAGFNGGSARSRGDNPNSSHARDWSNYADTLPAAVSRLMTVVIENRPAIELMRQHDAEETLFYVDPPYIADTRSDRARKAYRHELDDEQHQELLVFLKTLSGMVVLSGYAHPMYDAALTGWRRIEREAMADGAQPRTEVVWLNPACAAALDQQMPALFDLATFDAVNTPPPPLTDLTEAESD